MILLLYAAFCVGFAYWNYKRITDGKKIKHFWNGLIHLTACVLFWYFSGWKDGISVLLIARLVFDVSLNAMRKLSLGYVPLNPKSIVDKAEKWIFKTDGITPKIVYLFLFVLLQII